MSYCFIACEDGIDTVELQSTQPELFDVAIGDDGVACCTLRPDARAAIRALIENTKGQA